MTDPDPVRAVPGREKLLLIALVLAAGGFLFATRRMAHSVWFDESQTVLVARQSTAWDIAMTAAQRRAYPPLFFFVVHGALRFRDDEIGLRLPAAAFGALSVVAVFLLGRALSGNVSGALAAFLFVLTPGVMRYFVDGNAYTLLILLSTLSTLFLLRSAGTDKNSDWLCYFVFTLLGLATHTMYIFYFGAQIVAGCYLRATASPAGPRSWRRFAVVMGALCAIEMLWVLFFFAHGGDDRAPNLARLLHVGTLGAWAGMLPGPMSAGPFVQLIVWAPLAVLGGALLFIHSRRKFWFLAIYAGLGVTGITLFLKLTLPYVAYKHGMGMFPLVCVVAAHSYEWARIRRSGAGVAWSGVVRALICAAVAVYGFSGAVFMTASDAVFEYQDWRSAAGYLTAHTGTGDAVVLSGLYDLDPLSYYYRGAARVVEAGDAGKVCGVVSGLLARSKPSVKSVWIVVSTFENENPIVAGFTQTRRTGLEARTQLVLSALREQGFSAGEAARFHRVRILFVEPVRRGSVQ